MFRDLSHLTHWLWKRQELKAENMERILVIYSAKEETCNFQSLLFVLL
jgi:hypothetical protein